MSKRTPTMSWSDRFTLIQQYNPDDATICKVFNLSDKELSTARALFRTGQFRVNPKLDVTKYAHIFADQPKIDAVAGQPTTHLSPQSATRRSAAKVPQKRGRKGNKIVTAFLAIPSEPMPVEDFIAQYGVSLAVLRQSKRFISQMSEEDAAKVGNVFVRQDKTTKVLMIWREDIPTEDTNE